MNIEITIGGPLADAINNLAAALQTHGALEKAAQTKSATAAKPKPADTPKTAADTPKPAAADTAPSMIDLRAACDAVVDKHGIAKIKDFLASMGFSKLAEVPEDARANLLAEIRGML